jgi:hypothetical protein
VAAFSIKIEGASAGWGRWMLFNGLLIWLTVFICQQL